MAIEIVSPAAVAAASRSAGDPREGTVDIFWLAKIGDLLECHRREQIAIRGALDNSVATEVISPTAVKSSSVAARDPRTGDGRTALFARIGDLLECMRREQVATRATLSGQSATPAVLPDTVKNASSALGEQRGGFNEAAMLARVADLLECMRQEQIATRGVLESMPPLIS